MQELFVPRLAEAARKNARRERKKVVSFDHVGEPIANRSPTLLKPSL